MRGEGKLKIFMTIVLTFIVLVGSEQVRNVRVKEGRGGQDAGREEEGRAAV